MAKRSRVPSVRAIPWAVLAELAMVLRRHWDELSPRDRAEVARILKYSRGNPRTMTPRDRTELRTIAGKLRPGVIARDALPHVRRIRKR